MVKSNNKAIEEAAYFIWQNAGCPMGNDEYFWALAVEQLNSSNKSCKSSSVKASAAAKKSPAKKSSTVTAKKPVAKKKK